MNRQLLAAFAALTLLGACGGLSALNPLNWFGSSQEAATPATALPELPVLDNRPLVDQVLQMAIEPMVGGAIVRAVGLPPTQGWWDAELVAENDGRPVGGELRLRFVVAAPRTPQPQGGQVSREVTAGYYVSDFRLAGINRIVVLGASNSRVSTR